MRLYQKVQVLKLLNQHLGVYPTPMNLNWNWSWGSLSGLLLASQIVTGILLAMHYVGHVDHAFASVQHLMVDVPSGVIIRYAHANGASLFFTVVYLHVLRGLYYSSGTQPREILWISGVIILLLMIITAFIGYVLPWGQMSFWGATVITSLATVIPVVGKQIVYWLWGGFSIDHPTLNRFYSFHYTLPFILAGLSIFHIAALHQYGSTNPLGINTQGSTVHFGTYFASKDLLAFLFLLLVFAILVFFYPEYLGHPDNLVPANPYSTPAHIVPEWYFCTPSHSYLGNPNLWGMLLILIIHYSISYLWSLKRLSGSIDKRIPRECANLLGWNSSYDHHGYVKKLESIDNNLAERPYSTCQALKASKLEGTLIRSGGFLENILVCTTNKVAIRLQEPKMITDLFMKNSGLPKDGNVYGNRAHVLGFCSKATDTKVGSNSRKKFNNPNSIIPPLFNKKGIGCAKLVELKKLNTLNTGLINYNLIHLISNIELLVFAYESIKSIQGNMTRGSDNTTLDSISLDWFAKISLSLKAGKFQFKPARRVMIPKPGKTELRPLGVVNPRDKIVQKALLLVLEAIYEPTFLDVSHGFRPNKGTHSALKMVDQKFKNVPWIIEGDISKCFDSIRHSKLMSLISQRISCVKTLSLIRSALEAGYVLDNKWYSQEGIGTPQGGVISPILANIYMHELDRFIADLTKELNLGDRRGENPTYSKLNRERGKALKEGNKLLYKSLGLEMRKISSRNLMDPKFIRIVYVRYADDFIIGVFGSLSMAESIKQRIAAFLDKELGLSLSLTKTKITNCSNDNVSFLGAEIKNRATHIDKPIATHYREGKKVISRITPRLSFHVPMEKLFNKFTARGFIKYNANGSIRLATAKKSLVNLDHADILGYYNSVISGVLNYYSFADNRSSLGSLYRKLKDSCALTLALKYKLSTMGQTYAKFKRFLACPVTNKTLINPGTLKRTRLFQIGVQKSDLERSLNLSWASKYTKSNLHKTCIICGNKAEMHHVRAIKDLKQSLKLDWFTMQMAAINRKQVPLCRPHHMALHHNKLSGVERLAYKDGIEKFAALLPTIGKGD